MKFDRYLPAASLLPYIKHYVVSESDHAREYKVFPSAGLVIGFQYKGRLATIADNGVSELSSAGITGIIDTYRTFSSSADIGTILVYFTEIGFAHFAKHPANEIFGLSLSLDHIFDRHAISELEEKLAAATGDLQRIQTVEAFLLARLMDIEADWLVLEAVKMIYDFKGTLRIGEITTKLRISQSSLEKRFRKVVGTSPKKFASIVRFNAVLDTISASKSLTDICYENNFFDQAHFIKDFKQYTGSTPENFKRFL